MDLKCIAWNCHSVKNKHIELSDFLNNFPQDIILLSETRLKESDYYELQNFNCYRVDRQYGGVAIFINKNIPHSGLLKISFNYAEAVTIKIIHPSGDFTITSLYCSPAASRAQAKDFFNRVLSVSGSSVIAGDFNAKHQRWNNSNFCRKGSDLVKLCDSKNFQIYGPNSPTLYPYVGNPSIVDFVLGKAIGRLSQPISLNVLSSDHLPISFMIPLSFNSPLLKLIPNFNQANWKKFRSVLDSESSMINEKFQSLDSIESIDICIDSLTVAISSAVDITIPKKHPFKHRYKFSNEIKLLTSSRNHYRNLYNRTRDPSHKSAMNQLNRLIKKQTSKFIESTFSDNLTKLTYQDNTLFSFTKALKKQKNSIPPLLRSDGSLVFSEQEKTEVLADAFHNCHLTTTNAHSPLDDKVLKSISDLAANIVVTGAPASNMCQSRDQAPPARSQNDLLCPYMDSQVNGQFEMKHIYDIINSLRTKKASGHDNISNLVLKNIPRSSIQLLTKIFNSCARQHYFPVKWKMAKIVPVAKPGKKHDEPNNYRPISLPSNIGKIFERLLLDRLNDFESTNKIFIDQQFGFRFEHSTTQQILRITECAQINFNKNRSTGLALLDLEKAFDSVWHDGLIHKMIMSGYPLWLIKMIHSYLNNRKAYVSINDSSSSTFDIPAGVPQGSLLSPHLFNIFINDIPLDEDVELAIFADDTALFCHSPWTNIKKIINKLLRALNSISDFFAKWKIRINKSKTEFIIFSHSNRMIKKLVDNPITFEGPSFDWKTTVKYLGVTLDHKLCFKAHIDAAIQKARGVSHKLFNLLKKNNSLPIMQKVAIYRSLIRPVMSYACPIFTNCPKKHFDKLQVQQNKILRMATNAPKFTRNDDIHAKANIPTFRDFVDKLTFNFYARCHSHDNHLVNSLGNYSSNNIGFRVKHRLPKHVCN
jgi:Reverse transcriptase (RNA-dependent DNA polymerase)/Endonuclease-reverse transcriptase